MRKSGSVWHGLRERAWAWSRPPFECLFYANGGLGDELMLTAIAEAASRQGRPIDVLTGMPFVWRDNVHARTVQVGIERWHYARRREWLATPLQHLAYDTNHRGRHIGQQMADHCGITLPAEWRPVLAGHPRPRQRHARRIVVQNSCRGARYAAVTKEWPQQRWHELVAALAGCEIVQIGTPADPALPGVLDLRGKTTLEEAVDLIAGAACFIGLESGLMHVAAATFTPAVIVYGGRTEPAQTGYPFHRHVTTHPPCRGCGLNAGCPHGVSCMDIPAADVLREVAGILQSMTPA